MWIYQLLKKNIIFFKVIITPKLKRIGLASWTQEKPIKNRFDTLVYAKSIGLRHFGMLSFIDVSLQTIVVNKKLNNLEFHYFLGFECSPSKINDIKREFLVLDLWETDDYFLESLDSLDQISLSLKTVTSELCYDTREYPEVFLTDFTLKNQTAHSLLIAGFDVCGFAEDSGAEYVYKTNLISQIKYENPFLK